MDSYKSGLLSSRLLFVLSCIIFITCFHNVGLASAFEGRPVYVQARPVYSKTVKSSSPKEAFIPKAKKIEDPNRVTQTVYGFLDFVTTIGNTVMVFTPQTKKVEALSVSSTKGAQVVSTTPSDAIPVVTFTRPSSTLQSVVFPSKTPKVVSVTPSSSVVIAPVPRVEENSVEDSESEEQVEVIAPTVIEASEVEPVTYSSSKVSSVSKPLPSVTVTPKIDQEENLIATEKKHSIVTPAPKKGEKLGLISQIQETRVEDGVTKLYETNVIGTHIGTNYVRLFQSTSHMVAPPSSVVVFPESNETEDFITEQSVRYSGSQSQSAKKDNEPDLDDPRIEEQPTISEREPEVDDLTNEEELSAEQLGVANEAEEQPIEESETDTETDEENLAVEPTPTGSEEQTHYILPQKSVEEPPAKIYISPVPKPNSYSRQPKFYVDVNPAKSVDFVVTATPTRPKPYSGRTTFASRFKKQRLWNKDKVDSNSFRRASTTSAPESTIQTTTSSSRISRGRSRFRPRSRFSSRKESRQQAVVSTVQVAPTPSRRFHRGGKTFAITTAAPSLVITPTSSSSIYRFKLNRPTGRWRFKPSPKPKVEIIKTQISKKQGEEAGDEFDEDNISESLNNPDFIPLDGEENVRVHKHVRVQENVRVEEPQWPAQQDEAPLVVNVSSSRSVSSRNGPVYYDLNLDSPPNDDEVQRDSNELGSTLEPSEGLQIETVRVATITPTELEAESKYLEVATIRSPYVFQAGNVKNTRYITLTETHTKDAIQPTATDSFPVHATLENILAPKAPYQRILEGSNDVATLPLIAIDGPEATPPLQTITQTFSTSELMLKTSILPVLYEDVTTLYTLTQSYFVTRLVTAHKTVPPPELFQFYPTKSLTEFNTALQEAGSEHREQLLSSEPEDDDAYQQIIAPPDDLELVGSNFDPSSMDKGLVVNNKKVISPAAKPKGPTADSKTNPLANLTPEQLAFLQYFNPAGGRGGFFPPVYPRGYPPFFQQPQQLQTSETGVNLPHPQLPQIQQQPAISSSPVVYDTSATITETKTLRILFGAKPTHTTLYSTKVVPTRVTSFVMASVQPTAVNSLFNAPPFPFSYLG